MIGIQHGPKDWILTKGNTENSINALYSRVRVSRKYDVPDLAGYAENGKDFYIDRGCPKECECLGKVIEVDKFLILHEEIELALIKLLHLPYQDCHQIACLGEKEGVEMIHEVSAWGCYSEFMRKQIDRAWNVKNPNVPPNLFKKPYVDEKQYAKLKQMGYVK